jgi:hypothetical protein
MPHNEIMKLKLRRMKRIRADRGLLPDIPAFIPSLNVATVGVFILILITKTKIYINIRYNAYPNMKLYPF